MLIAGLLEANSGLQTQDIHYLAYLTGDDLLPEKHS